MTRSDILNIAERVITGERQDAYGTPEDSFGRIADLWSAYLGAKISSEDVAHMMVLLKIARTKGQEYHVDNYVDICGYAALAAEMAEKESVKPGCRGCDFSGCCEKQEEGIEEGCPYYNVWKVDGERNKKLLKKAEDELNRRLCKEFEDDARNVASKVLFGED